MLSYQGAAVSALPAQLRKRVRNVRPLTLRGANVGPFAADQGGLSLDVIRSGRPDVNTYTIFTGLEGIEGVQVWPFIGVEMQSHTSMQYPQLKENPPPQKESKARLDALLKSIRLRKTMSEPGDFVELLGE